MNLSMNLPFCMWLGMHKYIYMIQSIHVGVFRHTWVCQKLFRILKMQYVKTELSYDGDFLHVRRHPEKQQIDLVISGSLTVWFLRFGPKFDLSIKLLNCFT